MYTKIKILTLCVLFVNGILIHGQTQVTRYTPKGSPVRAYNNIPEMSSTDKNDLSNYVSYYYPNATELNAPSATRSYNCHAYAWHVKEGGDRIWIGYYPGQEEDEDIYWTDGSYLQQSNEIEAEKISYYLGNHSAIQTSTQGIYISKWGQGPLMQHSRNYGPSIYNMNSRRYYKRNLMYISGPSSFAGQATYTLQNLPTGATVEWSVNDNVFIELISHNERGDSAVFRSDYYGSGIIYATITINNTDIVVSRYVYTDIDLSILNNCYINASDFACGTASFTMSNLPGTDAEVRWSCDAGIGYTIPDIPTYCLSTSAYPSSHPGVDKMKAQITYKGKTQDWEHEFNFNFNRPYVYYQVGDTILSDYGFYSYNGLATIDVQYEYPFNWMNSEWSVYGWGWDYVYGSNEFATFEGPTGVPDIMIELCFDTPCGGRTCYQRELAVPRSLHGISASAFSLSPNPASDNVTISLAEDTKAQNNRTIKTASSSDDSYEIQLWNSFGLVKQVTTAQPKYQLSLSGIPAGFYYVHVIKDKMTYRKQLIVK